MHTDFQIPDLKTERLQLEPLSMEHSAGMYKLWQQDKVHEHAGPVNDQHGNSIPLPAKRQSDSDRIIQFWLAAAASGWGFRWAILLTEENKSFVGHIGFNSLGECAELAYHLNPDHWGNGIMHEAALAAIQWIQLQGTDELEAYIEPSNTKSIALAHKLGMKGTGTVPEGAERYHMRLMII